MPPEITAGGAASGISANSPSERICQTPSGKFEPALPKPESRHSAWYSHAGSTDVNACIVARAWRGGATPAGAR